MKNKPEKQFNSSVPESLLKEFHIAIERLGLKKKRAIAAALLMMIDAKPEAAYAAYKQLFEEYYVANDISFIEWLVPVDVEAGGKEVKCDLFNENASTIHNKPQPN